MYIKHVAQHNGTLVNIALDNELSLNDDSNILYLTRNFSPYYNNDTNYEIPEDKNKLKKMIISRYDRTWTLGLTAMSKADTYRSLKPLISFEQYLRLVKNHKHRIALSRLRLSSHSLQIEKGRHRKPPLPRLERKCPFCTDQVENECHFIINCSLYNRERGRLLQAVVKNSINFNQIPSANQKFIFILTNEDPNVLCELALFLFNAFKIRNQHLENRGL